MVSRLWTPLTEQRTKLSTIDGNCGQKARLALDAKEGDSEKTDFLLPPLDQWRGNGTH